MGAPDTILKSVPQSREEETTITLDQIMEFPFKFNFLMGMVAYSLWVGNNRNAARTYAPPQVASALIAHSESAFPIYVQLATESYSQAMDNGRRILDFWLGIRR